MEPATAQGGSVRGAVERPRTFTVGTVWTGSRLSPMLRLRGAWLAAAGFGRGARVRVTIETGRLVVTVEPRPET